MYNQFFSGGTATQKTGKIPAETIHKMHKDYLLKSALGQDVSLYSEFINVFKKIEKGNKSLSIAPLLELETDVAPEKISEPEIPEISPRELKKHNLNIFPEMDEEDYSALKNDIQKNGYDPKYPIWLYNGDILDGWNRQKVCSELNITPVYKNFIGNDLDAIVFVVRSNNRRNLTPSQRACIALDYASIFEKFKTEAKQRQIVGGKNKVRQNIAQPKKDENKTDTKVAKLFDTNRTYIQKARKIRDKNPEIFEKIKSGAETISNINKKGIFTGENEWHIPKEYIEKVKTVFGKSDLNPTTYDVAQETVQATTNYTIITNELDKNWNGNVFVNPPYSTADVVAFMDKFIEEYNSGQITQSIILTNNSTHADWFHKIMKIAQLACFTDGRVKFYHQEKKPNITHGQVFFYIGNNENKFIEEFKDLGLIMRKV